MIYENFKKQIDTCVSVLSYFYSRLQIVEEKKIKKQKLIINIAYGLLCAMNLKLNRFAFNYDPL